MSVSGQSQEPVLLLQLSRVWIGIKLIMYGFIGPHCVSTTYYWA